MKHTLKKLTVLATIILLLGLGCKGPTEEEAAAVRPVTINYWTVFNDVSQLRKFAAEYQQLRPYIRINIRQLRYDEFSDVFTNALADDVAPDIISVHNQWLRDFQPRLSSMPASVSVATVTTKGTYAPEQIVTLENNAMPTSRAIQSAFVQSVPKDIIIGGDIYGLPLAVDTLALYYNRDLLDKSGIALAPENWEQFLEAVRETTRIGANGQIIQSGVALGTGSNIDYAADIFALLLAQRGVDVTRGGRVTIADGAEQLGQNHPAFEVLRFYSDFARETKEAYTWNDEQPNAFDAFVRNKSVFYIGYAYDYQRIKAQAPQMNLEVLPIPQLNEEDPTNIANYWVESVVKKSKHQDIAWDFIRFITTPTNIKIYTEATNQPSPLRIHLAEQVEDPVLGPFAEHVLTAQNWYTGRNVDAARNALEDLLDAYKEPYPANVQAQQRDNELLNRAVQRLLQTM